MTTIAELDALIARPREDENLEFKEAKETFATPKIYKYCVAIANEGGGQLILGVTNDPPRQIVGTAGQGRRSNGLGALAHRLVLQSRSTVA